MAFDPSTLNKKYTKLPIPSDFITSQNTTPSTPIDPQILWIGCSDSLVLETECLPSLREEMFVYRNLGGLVVNGDLSTQSAIEWGVSLLKVKHVVVCGHYGCAVVCGKGRGKSTGTGEWERPIVNLRSLSQTEGFKEMGKEETERERERHFEEQYILAEVEWLKSQEIVKDAIEKRGLQVHAFVYDRETNVCERLVDDEGKGVEASA